MVHHRKYPQGIPLIYFFFRKIFALHENSNFLDSTVKISSRQLRGLCFFNIYPFTNKFDMAKY